MMDEWINKMWMKPITNRETLNDSACKSYLEWSYLKKQKVEGGVAQIWERSGGEGIII